MRAKVSAIKIFVQTKLHFLFSARRLFTVRLLVFSRLSLSLSALLSSSLFQMREPWPRHYHGNRVLIVSMQTSPIATRYNRTDDAPLAPRTYKSSPTGTDNRDVRCRIPWLLWLCRAVHHPQLVGESRRALQVKSDDVVSMRHFVDDPASFFADTYRWRNTTTHCAQLSPIPSTFSLTTRITMRS